MLSQSALQRCAAFRVGFEETEELAGAFKSRLLLLGGELRHSVIRYGVTTTSMRPPRRGVSRKAANTALTTVLPMDGMGDFRRGMETYDSL